MTDPNPDAPSIEDLTKELDKWKSHARKWEDRAKENSKAAEELDALRKSTMTDDEKRATELQEIRDALAKAEERAAKTEAANLRLAVANEFGLSPDDAPLLESVSGEDAMRALATRLAGGTPPAQSGPKPNPTQGKDTGKPLSAKDATIEALGGLF